VTGILIGFGAPVSGAWATPQNIATFAARADQLGYASLWSFQRLIIPEDKRTTMEPVYHSVLDPMATLAYAAAVTTRIRLGVAVINAPFVSPAYLAKQAASLDVLSAGRHDLGLGIGWLPEEFELSGAQMARRGARTAEYIQVLHALWADGVSEFSGEFYQVPRGDVAPKPVQPGGPPIWCGGRSDAALRRTGRLAEGWISYVVTPDMYAQSLAKIDAAASEAGRHFARGFGTGHLLFARIDDTYEKALDAATVSLSRRYAMDFRKAAQRYAALGPPAEIVANIRRFHAAGVRHVILDLVGPYEERDRQIERFATEALPLLADLRG
jgi:probable F420-dependent oxidoreductase